MEKTQSQDQSRAEEFGPSAWFAALERALRTNDRQLAVLARLELRRLGVTVRFGKARPSEHREEADRG